MNIHTIIEEVFHTESGRVLAALIASLGDFDLAEDVMQEAFIIALEKWPEMGIPRNPGAWITTTARNRAIDRLRRNKNWEQKQAIVKTLIELEAQTDAPEPDELPDERLKLIFTCCHPALKQDAQIALTLRTLGGLTTEEIAHAFLLPPKTMAQRIVRAKRKIKQAKIPYQVPPPHLLHERLDRVMHVLYLIFNEGYDAAYGDQLIRHDLCDEAIRLTEVLVAHIPDQPELLGLLALMLLQHSRRDARLTPTGELVLLPDQDRSLWDRGKIDAGTALIEQAMEYERSGAYQVQAAIAALHAEADSAETTDWHQITLLYRTLYHITPTPIIRLNWAVAFAMANGPMPGLTMLDQISADGQLDNYYLFHAARADLLRRAGWRDHARTAYTQALALANNGVEQAFLQSRLDQLSVL